MTSRCESNGCIEIETVGDVTRVWDTARPEQVLEVPAASWAAHEAALRAQGWAEAVAAVRDGERYYDWCRTGGHVPDQIRERYAVYLEALAEVRDEEKGNT